MNENTSADSELILRALEARQHSYCSYSHWAVGAALLTSDGKIYTGANIENASYTPTICAERNAFFKAVYDGYRYGQFEKIAIVGGTEDGEITDFCYPCGVCRQVMREFCSSDFELLFTDGREVKKLTLGELLPYSFGPEDLAQKTDSK